MHSMIRIKMFMSALMLALTCMGNSQGNIAQSMVDTSACTTTVGTLNTTDLIAVPWMAPSCVKFKYAGLENDLPRLLSIQSSPSKWIFITYMTAKIKRFVLNCLHSVITQGGNPHYVVTTFEDESLIECKALNLPCFNASGLTPERVVNEEGTSHGSPLQWTKIHISLNVLKMGYNVHASDADVVYLRNTNKSYERVMKATHADAVFASEEVDPTHSDGDEESLVDGEHSKRYMNMVNSGVCESS